MPQKRTDFKYGYCVLFFAFCGQLCLQRVNTAMVFFRADIGSKQPFLDTHGTVNCISPDLFEGRE